MQCTASLGMIYSNMRRCHGGSYAPQSECQVGKNATEAFCQAAAPGQGKAEPLCTARQRPAADWQDKKLTGLDIASFLFCYYG